MPKLHELVTPDIREWMKAHGWAQEQPSECLCGAELITGESACDKCADDPDFDVEDYRLD